MPVLADGGFFDVVFRRVFGSSRSLTHRIKRDVPLMNPILSNPYPYNFAQNVAQSPVQSNTYQVAPVQSYPYYDNPQAVQLVPTPRPNVIQRWVILPIKRVWKFVVRYVDMICNNLMALNMMGIGIPWMRRSWILMEWIVNKIVDGINDVVAAPLKIRGISLVYKPIYYLIYFVIRAAAGFIIYPAKFLMHEIANLIMLAVHVLGQVVTLIWHIPFDIVLFFINSVLKMSGVSTSALS